MACNILIDNNNKLRVTQFVSSSFYDIGDINFYTPIDKKNYQVFVVLKTDKNLCEIVKLTKVENNPNNTNILYKMELNQRIRIKKEPVSLYLLLLNTNTNEYINSNTIRINLDTDRYHCARRVAILETASKEMYNLYMEMLSMYSKIQKGVNNE